MFLIGTNTITSCIGDNKLFFIIEKNINYHILCQHYNITAYNNNSFNNLIKPIPIIIKKNKNKNKNLQKKICYLKKIKISI